MKPLVTHSTEFRKVLLVDDMEATQCDGCGWMLNAGDVAVMWRDDLGSIFCKPSCARLHRGRKDAA